jgi:hypothetical protein
MSNVSEVSSAVVPVSSAVVGGAVATVASGVVASPVVISAASREAAQAELDRLFPPAVKTRKVRLGRTYYAARELFRSGIDAEITREMGVRVDEACGKPNTTESVAWLKLCVPIIQGWIDAESEKRETEARQAAQAAQDAALTQAQQAAQAAQAALDAKSARRK